MSVIFEEYQPPVALRPCVEFFWEGKFNPSAGQLLSQRVIPNGYVELIIHLSDLHCELLQDSDFSPSPAYTLIGLFTKPYDVRFKGSVEVFGIRFKPEGIFHLFGVPAAEFREGYADAEALTGKKFRAFCSRLRETGTRQQRLALSEQFLLNALRSSRTGFHYLNKATELIRRWNGQLSIEELAGKVFISPRQLEREFKQKIGLSPKQYMRIARLNEVNRLLENGNKMDLTGISYESGYADQAHFIRDFKSFTGISPKVFLKKREEFIVNAGVGT